MLPLLVKKKLHVFIHNLLFTVYVVFRYFVFRYSIYFIPQFLASSAQVS